MGSTERKFEIQNTVTTPRLRQDLYPIWRTVMT
jgi:hypothetical protein